MDSEQLNDDGNSTEKKCLKQSPLDSPDTRDLFGDRQLNPRIGDEYQVEIRPMITGTDYIQLLMNPTDSNVIVTVSHSFLMGLPIPIMWLHEVNNIEDQGWKVLGNSDDAARADGPCKNKKSKKSEINMGKKGSKLNASDLHVRLNNRKESTPENFDAKIAGRTNLDQLCICTSYYPVPGLIGDTWSDAEKDIFLLGLYIFRKNFFQIKRFIETKEMGDILSFYYGEFYRSNEYRRWSDCRKPRSRKCVYGRKIFTGWRLQELLSRLLPRVSEVSHNSLLEVSKSFAEERTSLENYVSYLKSTVGFLALIESVGIGKGKEDLTSLAMEPVKTNQLFPVCPTMPSGKACSSLTSSDIINFLTGGFRLSKARCNDIFWEAVWPRLLARGWHSEQPKNRGYVSTKDYLVFLMPGVKKFSRRKLVKGDHYFDSVSDILNKVASEPKLLELEAEEATVSNCNDKDRWIPEELSDQDDPHQRPHCYLKPRTSKFSERMKFMVVDSSLLHGGKSSKVRELRFLPVDFKDTSKGTSLLRENKGYFFENSLGENKLDAANILLNGEKSIGISEPSRDIFDTSGPDSMKFMVVDTSSIHGGKLSKVRSMRCCPVQSTISSNMKCLTRVDKGSSSDDSLHELKPNAADKLLNPEPDASDSVLNGSLIVDTNSESAAAFDGVNSNETTVNSDTAKKMVMCQDQKTNKSDEKKSKRIIKHHFSRRSKSGNTSSLAPIVKRRRLTACAKTETSRIVENFSAGLGSEEVGSCCILNSPDAGYKYAGPSLEKISSCQAEGSPEEESSGCIFNGSCFGMEMPYGENENHQIPSLIDLNLSQNPGDSENGELLKMEVEDSQGMNSNGSFFHANKLNLEALKTSADVSAAEQQPNMKPRRQSTRNRPLTAKALEALACGFLNISKKEKTKEFHTQGISFSNPSRRARSRIKVSSKRTSAGTVIVDLKEEKEVDETSIVNKDIASKPLNEFEERNLNIC